MNEEQLTLMDVEKLKRTHRPYKRISRTYKERINAHLQYLRLIKLRMDAGQEINYKQIQRMCNIGHPPTALLPDLSNISIEDLTFDLAEKWYVEKVKPYHKAKNDKMRGKKNAEPQELEQLPASPEMKDQLKIYNDFMQDMTTLINNYKQKLQL